MNYLKISSFVLVTFVLFSSNTCKKATPLVDKSNKSISNTVARNTHEYKRFPLDPYADSWKQAQQFYDEGKYKSAHNIVDEIDQKASKDKNEPEIVRALLAKYNLASAFMEDAEFLNIQDIELRTVSATGAQKSLLHLLAGRMYWSYYQRRSYVINNRTVTEEYKNDDFRTWDASKFQNVAKAHHLLALQDIEALKSYATDNFKPILSEVELNKDLVASLYDLVQIEVMRFFKSATALSTTVEDNSGFDYLMVPYENFIAAEFKQIDNEAHRSVLKIYQDLIRNYHEAKDWNRVVFWDMERLDYIKLNSTGDNKQTSYIAALNKIIERDLPTQENAMAYAKMALEFVEIAEMPELLSEKKRKVYARSICEKAIKKFDENSLGVKKCKEIMAYTENQTLSFTIEGVIPAQRDALVKVNYQNINAVHFKIYRLMVNPIQAQKNKRKVSEYIKEQPLFTWRENLRDLQDFEGHSFTGVLPKLDYGRYLLIASPTSDLTEEHVFFHQEFYVSDMTLSTADHNGETTLAVHNSETGAPLSKVDLKIYQSDYDYDTRGQKFTLVKSLKTDQNGEQRYSTKSYNNSMVLVSKGNDSLVAPALYLRSYKNEKPKTRQHLQLFTDRAIYRPGQEVFFKGIVYEGASNQFKVVPKKTGKIILRDVNYQKVAEFNYTTNEYGSFSGKFTLPLGGLNGVFSIQDEKINSYHTIQVEEYKRPKFEVKTLPLAGEYKFNEEISVKGEAKAFSGQVIDGAKVSYRITESYIFPRWNWYWRGNFPSVPEKQIAFGELTTDAQGQFEIKFVAKPNSKYGLTPYFVQNYSIRIEVVDITGETQSTSAQVAVGNHAMQLNVKAHEIMSTSDFKKIELRATNLNGQDLKAKGTLEIIALEEPRQVRRNASNFKADYYAEDSTAWAKRFPNLDFFDLMNPNNFKELNPVFRTNFDTEKSNDVVIHVERPLAPGHYKIKAKTQDKFGVEITDERIITVMDKAAKSAPTKEILRSALLSENHEPGQFAEILVMSGAEQIPVLLEVLDASGVVQRERVLLSNSQQIFRYKIKEQQRGGIFIRISAWKFGQLHTSSHYVAVPFSNKELSLKFETFRSKLSPGSDEQWKMTIRGKFGDKIAAELLAALYDASLDQFAPNDFQLALYYAYFNQNNWINASHKVRTNNTYKNYSSNKLPHLGRALVALNYNYFLRNEYFLDEYYDYGWGLGASGATSTISRQEIALDAVQTADRRVLSKSPMRMSDKMEEQANFADLEIGGLPAQMGDQKTAAPEGQIRKNLQETAFFFPHLQTNAKGEVVINFTMPEALTRWKFISLAHTKDMRIGALSDFTMTQKDLMIQPNAPRFLRQGDTLNFVAKVSNLSEQVLTGHAKLELFDARTMQPVNHKFQIAKDNPIFILDKGQNKSVSWKMIVPDDVEALVYRVSADAGNFVDGEENMLPILSNRMLVIESLPLPSKGVGTREFRMEKLWNSSASKTIKHHSLTLEYTSNPAWYAVQAIPYLMEYPHECAEQLFSRYYANALASHIVQSNPKIKEIFQRWEKESQETLVSNLEKNQELKYLLLNETPWVMEAKNESERKKRLGLLFNLAKMERELEATLRKLKQMQSPNGGFPWFKGMPDNPYITKHIVMGAGHLDRLGIKAIKGDKEVYGMIQKAVKYMDERFYEQYLENKKYNTEFGKEDIIHFGDVQYFYARSYFNEIPMRAEMKPIKELYLNQMVNYRNKFSLQGRAMIALCLHRNELKSDAQNVIAALRDVALTSDEMGMYWKDNVAGYYWHQAPIETQALLIEAFDEVTRDLAAVEEMKIWLLKHKQTNDWKTTKATTMAVYALFMRGTDILSDDDIVDVFVGDRNIKLYNENHKTEAGTGYYKHTWSGEEIQPIYGDVKVVRKKTGVSWGAMYWQYFEDLDKITPHDTPLKLKKQLILVRNSPTGEVMMPLSSGATIKPGDKLRVRIELRSDRDMEFVRLKDMRAAGFEPVNVISSYKYQGGIGYYESTKDASTDFFIDFLRKGVYVFEYDLRANLAGKFSNGVATIQCMYAPEFSSHSEGIRVQVE